MFSAVRTTINSALVATLIGGGDAQLALAHVSKDSSGFIDPGKNSPLQMLPAHNSSILLVTPLQNDSTEVLNSVCNDVAKGIRLFDQGKLEEARETFERHLLLSPDCPHVIVELLLTFNSLGSYSEAQEAAECWISKNPESRAEIYEQLGIALDGLNDFKAGENAFRESIVRAPNFFRLYYNMALNQEFQGRDDSAIVYYVKDLELNPGHQPAWHRLGLALMRAGYEYDGAACLLKFLVSDPSHEDAADIWRSLQSSWFGHISRREISPDTIGFVLNLPERDFPDSSALFQTFFVRQQGLEYAALAERDGVGKGQTTMFTGMTIAQRFFKPESKPAILTLPGEESWKFFQEAMQEGHLEPLLLHACQSMRDPELDKLRQQKKTEIANALSWQKDYESR